MVLLENLAKIRQAVQDCGREVVLVAASKMQNTDTIDTLMKVAPDFILGENRVQELRDKFNPKYRWHVIGQLQTNKVKYIIDKVELIHSLDRLDLAFEIEKQASKINKVQNCLVEINLGAEITKGGVAPDELMPFLESLAEFKHIEISGIMSVLPNLGDTPELHALYEKLYGLFLQLKSVKQDNVNIKYLSAGMSNDYQIALQHGANMIRLGRILFGERVYPTNEI
ncbi:MAG: YggS family pyridoxal phosphate-dependent enzyme [Clostridia bacterium]